MYMYVYTCVCVLYTLGDLFLGREWKEQSIMQVYGNVLNLHPLRMIIAIYM